MSFAQSFQFVTETPRELVSGRRMALAALLVLVAAYVPYTGSYYLMSVFMTVFFWVTLTQSWNLISGYAGYLSFGHAIFLGTGAFTTAYLITEMQVHWFGALAAAALVGVLIAIIIGYPVLRLRGIYFAIGMLVLNEVARLVAEQPLSPITNGLRGIIISGQSRFNLYYIMLVLAIITVLTMYFVVNTRIGLYLKAIREHSTAAESVGVNTVFWKIFAFCLSAVYISVAGGIHAMYITYIDPSVVFNIQFNVQMIFMTIIGGLGTIAGPLFGAITFGLFTEGLSIYAPVEFQQALTGLALVLIVYYQPEGLYGIYEERAATIERLKDRLPI